MFVRSRSRDRRLMCFLSATIYALLERVLGYGSIAYWLYMPHVKTRVKAPWASSNSL